MTSLKKHPHLLFAISFLLLIGACRDKKNAFDASGSFEAEETIISSEASGEIRQFDIEEGQELKADQFIGYVDSLQLALRKEQLEAQIKSTGIRIPDVTRQTAYFDQQIAAAQTRLDNLLINQKRYKNLVAADVAPQKQLDDVNAQVAEAQKQIAMIREQQNAQRSVLETQAKGLKSDAQPLYIQIRQIQDQLQKCRIINPLKGTVLTKYAETFEMTAPGKPLYKIADLSSILLRAYISGEQLPQVKVGQSVKVLTDDGNGGFKETQGTVTWINDKAEFTPKTIQTKDERVNMVYAMKVKVKNDGTYKIGMYGEIKFN